MTTNPTHSRQPRPAPAEIRAVRESAGITQTFAAGLLHTTCRVYQQWESGEREMHPAFFDLFRRKVKEIKTPA